MQYGELQSSFFISDYLIAKPGLVRREIPEWQTMMVFEPDGPKLCVLNPLSWLLLELCDGSRWSDVENKFVQLLGNRLTRADAQFKMRMGVNLLVQFGLLLITSPKPSRVLLSSDWSTNHD